MRTVTTTEGTYKVRTINAYIVTAYEFRKRRRVTLTQRISYKKAQECLNRLNFDLKICIEKYKFFTDIRIEKCTPEYA